MNNPVLIGEPGVGKTAIVEGLAQRIVNGEVPEGLDGKRLLPLDMGAPIAGAHLRGEFEERMKAPLNDLAKQHGHIILFIDERARRVPGPGTPDGSEDSPALVDERAVMETARASWAWLIAKVYEVAPLRVPALPGADAHNRADR